MYPQDFIVDSNNQNTGKANANNELVVTLTKPTLALGLDLGGLGFSGASSGTVTLSNGHSFTIPSLPTVGHTTFVGFTSTVPITSFTFATTNDSWVLEDVLLASPTVSNCTFAIVPDSESFEGTRGLGSVGVITGAGCAWNATYNESWITPFPPQAQGVGPGKVSFAVAPNAGVARSGTIAVGGLPFRVNQKAGTNNCTYSVSPTHTTFDDSGGEATVVVNTPNGCVWTATGNADWLTINSGTSGAGTAAVVLHAAPNAGGARSGTATIAGQTFTATQGGGACGALDVTGQTMSDAVVLIICSFRLTSTLKQFP